MILLFLNLTQISSQFLKDLIQIYCSSVHTDLIVAILCDVAHPRKSLVSAFLYDLEISDLDARDSKVRNLELDLDGHTAVLLPLFRLD